jgi:hypothetical protein
MKERQSDFVHVRFIMHPLPHHPLVVTTTTTISIDMTQKIQQYISGDHAWCVCPCVCLMPPCTGAIGGILLWILKLLEEDTAKASYGKRMD